MSFFADATELPWLHFRSPRLQMAEQPSFVVGEVLFIWCALMCLVHAFRSSDWTNKWIWLSALIAGTANDVFFMALPQVDNFWQAQAMLMLTPRLPFYIPCVYISFLYIPTVSVRRLNIPSSMASAALAGLMGMLFYYPYDIMGAKFLWWTWFDSDPMVARRIFGAPTASTLWTLTFVAAFHEVTRRSAPINSSNHPSANVVKKLVVSSALMTTPLMVLMMTPLNLFCERDLEPGYRSLAAGIVIALYYCVRAASTWRPSPPQTNDLFLLGVTLMVLWMLVLTGHAAVPEIHRSTGVHQTIGDCNDVEVDLVGNPRQRFLCVKELDEPFDFSCAREELKNGDAWYTVCGKAHEDFTAWFAGLASIAGAGITVFLRAHFAQST